MGDVTASVLESEVGIEADPVQPRVGIADVDPHPVDDQFRVQRGAYGLGELLDAGVGRVVAVELHRGEVAAGRAAQVLVGIADDDLQDDVRAHLGLCDLAMPIVVGGRHWGNVRVGMPAEALLER